MALLGKYKRVCRILPGKTSAHEILSAEQNDFATMVKTPLCEEATAVKTEVFALQPFACMFPMGFLKQNDIYIL